MAIRHLWHTAPIQSDEDDSGSERRSSFNHVDLPCYRARQVPPTTSPALPEGQQSRLISPRTVPSDSYAGTTTSSNKSLSATDSMVSSPDNLYARTLRRRSDDSALQTSKASIRKNRRLARVALACSLPPDFLDSPPTFEAAEQSAPMSTRSECVPSQSCRTEDSVQSHHMFTSSRLSEKVRDDHPVEAAMSEIIEPGDSNSCRIPVAPLITSLSQPTPIEQWNVFGWNVWSEGRDIRRADTI